MSLKFKRHYKLVMMLVLVSVTLILGLGDQRIVAYTVPGSEPVATQVAYYGDDVASFNATVVHSIQALIASANR
jgi:hypothetical protein